MLRLSTKELVSDIKEVDAVGEVVSASTVSVVTVSIPNLLDSSVVRSCGEEVIGEADISVFVVLTLTTEEAVDGFLLLAGGLVVVGMVLEGKLGFIEVLNKVDVIKLLTGVVLGDVVIGQLSASCSNPKHKRIYVKA